MADHDIEHYDYGSAPCKLEDCSCRGIHAQFHTDIAVLELKKTYKVNEALSFTLKIQGFSKGGFMILSIAKENGPEIWNKKSFSNNPPGFPPHGFELTFKFPDEKGSIIIQDPGRYVLTVSVNEHEIQEKFIVVK